MRARLPAKSAQHTRIEAAVANGGYLSRSIRDALEKNFLNGRRLVLVKIRHVEGSDMEGFLKIDGIHGEHLLVDFKATSTPKGRLASLEVGGERVSVAVPVAKRWHQHHDS